MINTVIQGDCLEVMRGIEDKSVDLVLTDPPYNASNSGIKFKGYTTINEEWDKGFDPYLFLDQSFRILKPGGSLLVFCSYHLLGKYLMYGKKVQQIIHWKHNSAVPAVAKVYTPVIEYIVWYSTPNYTFNKSTVKTNCISNNKGYQVDGKFDHPSQKPTDLMKKLIGVHSNPNDLIVDPFIGSGSTLVAAKQLGRRYIGIEIDEGYCRIARERLKQEELRL